MKIRTIRCDVMNRNVVRLKDKTIPALESLVLEEELKEENIVEKTITTFYRMKGVICGKYDATKKQCQYTEKECIYLEGWRGVKE